MEQVGEAERLGERRPSKRPESNWIAYEAPELRIVSPELWDRVQQRLANVRRSYTGWTRGKLWGRPPAAVESKHLLLGLAVCQQCGGGIAVHSRGSGHGRPRRRLRYYGCTTRWNRGASICANDIVVPTAAAEDGVLAALEDQFRDPAIVRRAVAEVRRAFARPSAAERPQAVARELARVEAQVERLVDAVQLGSGGVAPLVERLRRLEGRRAELRTEQDRVRSAAGAPTARQLGELEADILMCLANWREMCRQQLAQTRRLLNDVLTKRMTWTPHSDAAGGYYEFTAECSLGRLISGVLGRPMRWWPQWDSRRFGQSKSVGSWTFAGLLDRGFLRQLNLRLRA